MSAPEFAEMDDPALIAERARIREELERFPAQSDCWQQFKILYNAATAELDDRARAAWTA